MARRCTLLYGVGDAGTGEWTHQDVPLFADGILFRHGYNLVPRISAALKGHLQLGFIHDFTTNE